MVTPSLADLCRAVNSDQLGAVDELIKAGLVIDEALFNEFLENYELKSKYSVPEIDRWTLQNVFQTFYKYGVDMTKNEEAWILAVKNWSTRPLEFLLKQVDPEWLFGNKNVIYIITNQEDPRYDPFITSLVDRGLDPNSFNGMILKNTIRNTKAALLYDLVGDKPEIDLYPFWQDAKHIYYDGGDMHEMFFEHLLDPLLLSDEELAELTEYLDRDVAMRVFAKFDENGWQQRCTFVLD